VIDAPPDRVLHVGDADAQRRIGAIEDEPDLVRLVPQLLRHLEEQADVLDGGRIALECAPDAAVWCGDSGRALDLLDRIDAGVGWVNNYGYLPPGAPFGGVKDSGFGRENGAATVDEYSDLQTVLVRHRGPGVSLY